MKRKREPEGLTSPASSSVLAGGLDTGKESQIEHLPSRITRYNRAKMRALNMAVYLAGLGGRDAAGAAGRLMGCGNYLHFRHYYTVHEVRLHAASFCKQHLICPLCAIRRGAKALSAYLARYRQVCAQNPALRPYLVTLTIRDGADLSERWRHLTKSFQNLRNRRNCWNKGKRGAPWTEFARVVGAVGSYEVGRGKRSGLWHPHMHMIALCESPPDQRALRLEWEGITGDSFMVDVRPFRDGQNDAMGFMEVMKYAVKFGGMSLADNWEVAQYLRGSRLLFSLGVFRGVEVPESLTDEPLDNLPYFDLFYRFFSRSGYVLTGESAPPLARLSDGSQAISCAL